MKNNTFKIPVSILLSSMACFAIGLYGALPWWSFMVTNFIVAIAIPQKPWVAFLTGAFLAGAGLDTTLFTTGFLTTGLGAGALDDILLLYYIYRFLFHICRLGLFQHIAVFHIRIL